MNKLWKKSYDFIYFYQQIEQGKILDLEFIIVNLLYLFFSGVVFFIKSGYWFNMMYYMLKDY